MKHSFVLLMAILVAANLSAQVYVGGGVGVHVGTGAWGGNVRDYGGNVKVTENSHVSIAPEIGYAFNDWLSMGTSVSFLENTRCQPVYGYALCPRDTSLGRSSGPFSGCVVLLLP